MVFLEFYAFVDVHLLLSESGSVFCEKNIEQESF